MAGVLVFFVSLIGLAIAPYIANAAAGALPTMGDVAQAGGLPTVSLAVFIIRIIRIFFGLLGFIATILLLYGGFVWMTSQGDPTKVEKAKQIIYNSIIGLIIIFSSYAIASFIIAWLTGISGYGGSTTDNIPGGRGDFGRSGIGAGPIESVYPAPNSTNIPINSRIVVTFKQDIDPSSVCMPVSSGLPNAGTCLGSQMTENIIICQSSDVSSVCLAEGDAGYDVKFSKEAFKGTKVTQASPTDFKTFVFITPVYLGNDDKIMRTFMANLAEGIKTRGSNGADSVFKGYSKNYYSWSFKTNGELDFNPPEVAKIGLYPNLDKSSDADIYTVDTQSTEGGAVVITALNQNAVSQKIETPPKINKVPFLGLPVSADLIYLQGGNSVPNKFLTISASVLPILDSDGKFSFEVFSEAGGCINFNERPGYNDNIGQLGIKFITDNGCCAGKQKCLPITNNKQVILAGTGITITSTGRFTDAVGSVWEFDINKAISGAVVTFQNGADKTNFILADQAYGNEIIKDVLGDDGKTIVSTKYYAVKTVPSSKGSDYAQSLAAVLNERLGRFLSISINSEEAQKITIKPLAAGLNSMSMSVSNADYRLVISGGSLAGEDRKISTDVKGNRDAYNNSKFRVTFNKPINPIDVDKFVNVMIGNNPVIASTTLTNQYRTIELTGTIPCGVNNCGRRIFCWVEPSSGSAASLTATINIVTANLKKCSSPNEAWCSQFGGTCAANERCQIASTGLFYPGIGATADGISDLSGNSFNGNFNTAKTVKGEETGNAEGPGVNFYNANTDTPGGISHNINKDDSQKPFAFTYANDDDPDGDSFLWSFFVSNQVDKSSPLLAEIHPTGDQAYGQNTSINESFRDPIELLFNTVMSYATLKPGWGYGAIGSDDWQIRYLALGTLTNGANPVGYWIGSDEMDTGSITMSGDYAGGNDGIADYTKVKINHNPFDQAVSYGPLVGSGVESITQNCFMPGNGPQNAGDSAVEIQGTPPPDKNKCYYTDAAGTTKGCVTDATVPVVPTNPASYGYMKCKDIQGTTEGGDCNDNNSVCVVSTGKDKNATSSSWIITKDHKAVVNGRTGCCFGKCFK